MIQRDQEKKKKGRKMDCYKKSMENTYISMCELKKLIDCADLLHIMTTYHKLEVQMQNPSRSGMIEVLRNSVAYAEEEIRKVCEEATTMREGTHSPVVTSALEFAVMTEEELLSLLPIYKQGLANHCIAEIGDALFFKCARHTWLYAEDSSVQESIAS